ncbi:hypothetical protein HK096_002322, partial [Nowakowskiella sp. JEL0078]
MAENSRFEETLEKLTAEKQTFVTASLSRVSPDQRYRATSVHNRLCLSLRGSEPRTESTASSTSTAETLSLPLDFAPSILRWSSDSLFICALDSLAALSLFRLDATVLFSSQLLPQPTAAVPVPGSFPLPPPARPIAAELLAVHPHLALFTAFADATLSRVCFSPDGSSIDAQFSHVLKSVYSCVSAAAFLPAKRFLFVSGVMISGVEISTMFSVWAINPVRGTSEFVTPVYPLSIVDGSRDTQGLRPDAAVGSRLIAWDVSTEGRIIAVSDTQALLLFSDSFELVRSWKVDAIHSLEVGVIVSVSWFDSGRIVLLCEGGVAVLVRIPELDVVERWSELGEVVALEVVNGESILFTMTSLEKVRLPVNKTMGFFDNTIDRILGPQPILYDTKANTILKTVTQTTPQASLARKLAANDFSSALTYATIHSLPTDPIHKAHFHHLTTLATPLFSSLLSKTLSAITDTRWLLDTSLRTTLQTPDATTALLDFALALTDKASSQSLADAWDDLTTSLDRASPAPQPLIDGIPLYEYIAARRRLWMRKDRLASFLATHSTTRRHFTDRFNKFEAADLVALATRWIVNARWAAAAVLVTRHRGVWHQRFKVASVLPLWADVRDDEIARLVPVGSSSNGWVPWRRRDWSEDSAAREYVTLLGGGNPDDNDDLESGAKEGVEEEGQWLAWRVKVCVDAGFVEQALWTAQLAFERKFEGAKALVDKMITLVAVPRSVSLEKLANLGRTEVVALMLADVTPESVCDVVEMYVAPYLAQEGGVGVVVDWMEARAVHNLDVCVALVKHWSALIGRRRRVVLRCAYASREASQALLVGQLFTACIEDDEDLEFVEPWHMLGQYVAALPVLEKYGVLRTVSQLRDGDEAMVVREIVRRGVGTEMLEDLRELKRLNIIHTGLQDLVAAVVSAMLRRELFGEVKKLVFPDDGLPLLVIEKVAEIAVEVAEEFFDNADEVDMTRGLLKSSFECLRVVPASQKTTPLLNLIHACHTLARLLDLKDEATSLPLRPIQIRHHTDRLSILEQLISQDPSYHAKLAFVLDLADKLVPSTFISHQRVRIALVDAALHTDNLESAVSHTLAAIALPVVDEDVASRDRLWRVCVRLGGRHGIDWAVRERVLAVALGLCPNNQVDSVLEAWRGFDIAQAVAKVIPVQPPHASHKSRSLFGVVSVDEMQDLNSVDDVVSALRVFGENDGEAWRERVRVGGLRRAVRVREALGGVEEREESDEFEAGGADGDALLLFVAKWGVDYVVPALLNCNHDESVTQFFDAKDETSDKFASYIFALRAFSTLSSNNSFPPIHRIPAATLTKLVAGISTTSSQGKFTKFESAARESRKRVHDESQARIETVLRSAGIDQVRWDADIVYRGETLVELSRRKDVGWVVELACGIGGGFVSEVVKAHLEFLFLEVEVISWDDVQWISELEGIGWGKVFESLTAIHVLLDGKKHIKLYAFYRFLLLLLKFNPEINQADTGGLKLRVELLETLQKQRAFTELDLLDLEVRNSGEDEDVVFAYLEIWQDSELSNSTVQTFIEIVPRLLKLYPLNIFTGKDELHIDEVRVESLSVRISSTVYLQYIEGVFSDIEWEGLDSESVDELLDEISG